MGNSLLVLGLLGLAIFAWLPDSFFRMVSWPWILIWQGAFLIIIGVCLGKLRQFNHPFYRLGFGIDWLILGLFFCLALSSIAAPFPWLAIQNSLLVLCYVVLLYGLRNSRFSPFQLCQGLVWIGAISAIISLAFWRPSPDMWLSDNFYDAIRNRFPLGHHNFTGGYFVLVLPIAAGLARVYSDWRRWPYSLCAVIITTALYASGSRGAWLGAIAILTITLLSGIVRSQGKTRFKTILLSSLILGLILVLLGSNPRVRALVSSSDTPDITHPRLVADGPTQDRIFMAQAAINILKDRPLQGLGPGNLGRVYERYRPLAAGTGLNQVQQLHNTPLQLIAELGLGGALVYLGAIGCLMCKVWQLRKTHNPTRQLSLTISLGFIGYGISSLSDYQLENIPIAATLVVLLAALSQLAPPLTSPTFSQPIRRWSSFFCLATLALILQFWLRTDLALWFTHQGLNAIKQGNLTQADNNFYTAAAVAPWDPTTSVLGAQQLTELAQTATGKNQVTLQTEAINLYQQALRVAPNDIWFNQNLAVLAWQQGDLPTAYGAITKVVQLSPRSKNHSYYLLGIIYQAMDNPNAAIEALALECLINPQALYFESWQQELASLKTAVFRRVLQHYQTIDAALAPTHPLSDSLREQIATLEWWTGISIKPPPTAHRPLLQALLTMENKPNQANDWLNRCISDTPKDAASCQLLRAWLQPDNYLTDYLQTTNLNPPEQDALRSHITTHRSLKDWLRSTTIPIAAKRRVAVSLLYRNRYAQKISSILVPENLRVFSLPQSIKLMALTWPREFSPLDQLVETIRADTLELPHPTRTQFQFTAPVDVTAP